MRKAVLARAALLCLASSVVWATSEINNKSAEFMPLSEIHAGMKGIAYTVFQGTKPEPMDVEVLGVLRNANGPKGNVILVRLTGSKPEYTGVVAGMSGSPVYFDGKLAGALAFRIGEFSKEPIAGVTPIERMLEINALDQSAISPPAAAASGESNAATRTASPAESSSLPTGISTNYLKPID